MPCNDARRRDAIMDQLQSTLTTHANAVAIVAGNGNMDLTDDRLGHLYVDSQHCGRRRKHASRPYSHMYAQDPGHTVS
jgi:hypothetical protein